MSIRTRLLLAAGLIPCLAAILPGRLAASDHADTAANYNRPGADMADVYVFPSPNKANVVLVMNVHPLIAPGQGTLTPFDPNVLYQIKIDNSTPADYIEDLVIQVRFSGAGTSQRAVVSGPRKPATTGNTAYFSSPYPTSGGLNTPFSITMPNGAGTMQVFAGGRSDPFFFDLERFFAILPDRQTPGTGQQVDNPNGIMGANTPQLNGFRGFKAGSGFDTTSANDLLAGLNVLSIVVELPRAALGGGMIRVWETTSVATGAPNYNFIQQDRLGRPAVNEALATVTANRHAINNAATPVAQPGSGGDSTTVKNDILGFMAFPAGRSAAIANVLAAVLVPDVLVADLSNTTDPASYLGVETGGATGGKFGGRALTDDVIDIDLGAIFGAIIPSLGLAPDDGKELPQFATDNIGPHADYMLTTFPYLGKPHP